MEASAPLYAAVWLSFFWRMHLKTQSSTLANKAGMSQFHYGQMLGDVQERLQTLEEDSSFREQIVEIANQVWPLVLTRSEKRDLEQEKTLSDMSLRGILAVPLSNPQTLSKMERLARSFRIEKNTDIARDAPVSLIFEKVIEALETGAVAPDPGSHNVVVEFFPDDPDLQEAVHLHIMSRVQNSNCHHIKWRGQWRLKEGLQKVCDALDMDLRKLVRMETPKEIEAVIAQYRKTRKRPSFWLQGSWFAAASGLLVGASVGFLVGTRLYRSSR